MFQVDGGLVTDFPRLIKVRQRFPSHGLPDPAGKLAEQLSASWLSKRVLPGMSIAVGVGSRGIRHLQGIVRSVTGRLKELRADPFIVPAMGSHGGASPEGRRAILEGYGITEQALGVPLRCSNEVVEIARTPAGLPVYFDRLAFQADGIVPINRVKIHTHFRGEVESGLMKMLAIGFGHLKGASTLHQEGFDRFHCLVPQVGKIVIRKAPVLFGVACLEDAFDDTADIAVLKPEEFYRREKAMLRRCKQIMARIMVPEIDLLIVDEIGKNISGAGVDTNIIGRFRGTQRNDVPMPRIKKVLIRTLSAESLGNACGIGYADLTVRETVEQIDYGETYTNAIAAAAPHEDIDAGKIPVFMDTDREAIGLGLRLACRSSTREARVVRIRNSLHLEQIYLSESIWRELGNQGCFTALGDLQDMEFDGQGHLAPF